MKACPTCKRLLFIDRVPFVDMGNAKTRRFGKKSSHKGELQAECRCCIKTRNKKAYAKRVAAAKEAGDAQA
jgi:hypothetical protein